MHTNNKYQSGVNGIITPREGACCCYYNGCIIVREGFDGDGKYSDTWDIYDLKTQKCIVYDTRSDYKYYYTKWSLY